MVFARQVKTDDVKNLSIRTGNFSFERHNKSQSEGKNCVSTVDKRTLAVFFPARFNWHVLFFISPN